VEFDKTGEHLATGDRGGRVVLFERLHPSKATQVRAWFGVHGA
jgi:serine/threonine-protein phosphatase 2A regulatory subunit B